MTGVTTQRTLFITTVLILGIVVVSFVTRIEDGTTVYENTSAAPEDASDSNSTNRIVGGEPVKRGVYPYQAALFLLSSFNCGGTLVDDSHVLTAAHCLVDNGVDVQNWTIYLRTTTLDPLDEGYVERKVAMFTVHPDYNDTSFENDIGLITLSERVADVEPVQLEKSSQLNETYVDRQATVIGFGRTSQILFPNVSFGSPSNNLKQVNITIIDRKDCDILYYDAYPFDDGSRLCASTLGGKGICQGDSGGPLFVDGVQIGINSAAAGCADPRYPAVFTRIAAQRQWIEAHSNVKT